MGFHIWSWILTMIAIGAVLGAGWLAVVLWATGVL